MKKLILTFVALVTLTGSTIAQNYIIINSEKIFKAHGSPRDNRAYSSSSQKQIYPRSFKAYS